MDVYDQIVHCYRIFKEHGLDDPLREILSLVDILTRGTLRKSTAWTIRCERS